VVVSGHFLRFESALGHQALEEKLEEEMERFQFSISKNWNCGDIAFFSYFYFGWTGVSVNFMHQITHSGVRYGSWPQNGFQLLITLIGIELL